MRESPGHFESIAEHQEAASNMHRSLSLRHADHHCLHDRQCHHRKGYWATVLTNEPTIAELFCIGCALKDATAKLQSLLAGKFFSIRMQLIFPRPGAVETRWEVYDGLTQKLHIANSLASVVNAAMIAIVDHAHENREKLSRSVAQ